MTGADLGPDPHKAPGTAFAFDDDRTITGYCPCLLGFARASPLRLAAAALQEPGLERRRRLLHHDIGLCHPRLLTLLWPSAQAASKKRHGLTRASITRRRCY